MTNNKARICLNMIVKDEVMVLDRLFNSVKTFIDYYLIVDTGSSDGTPDFIKDWMNKAGIDGQVHERPWVNFGHNRQQALELAVDSGRCDWVFFIDADEELVLEDPQIAQKLEKGVTYQIRKHHGSIQYALPNLVDVTQNRWQWKAPVHEYLEHLEGKNQRQTLTDAWIKFHEGEGVRSRGVTTEQKFMRDARLLEKELSKNPQDTRSQFYLAQSYKHAGHIKQAHEAYRKRAAMKGWEEEVFMAQLEVGRTAILMGKSESKVTEELLKAFEIRPQRAEPLYELAKYYREKGKYARAYIFAKAGELIPRPDDSLFVAHEVYHWSMLDELSVAAYWIGRLAESRECCEEILRRSERGLNLSPTDLKRVHQNLAFTNVGSDEPE